MESAPFCPRTNETPIGSTDRTGQGISAALGNLLALTATTQPVQPVGIVGVWLFFEGVLVDLFQVECLTYLNADVVPNHQLG